MYKSINYSCNYCGNRWRKKLELSHAILATNVEMSEDEFKLNHSELFLQPMRHGRQIESEFSHECETTGNQAGDCL